MKVNISHLLKWHMLGHNLEPLDLLGSSSIKSVCSAASSLFMAQTSPCCPQINYLSALYSERCPRKASEGLTAVSDLP